MEARSSKQAAHARFGKCDDVVARVQTVIDLTVNSERIDARDADETVAAGHDCATEFAQSVERPWQVLEYVKRNNEVELLFRWNRAQTLMPFERRIARGFDTVRVPASILERIEPVARPAPEVQHAGVCRRPRNRIDSP